MSETTTMFSLITQICTQNSIEIHEFSRRIGVTPDTVFSWMNGDRIPQRRHAKKISSEFGVSVDLVYRAAVESLTLNRLADHDDHDDHGPWGGIPDGTLA